MAPLSLSLVERSFHYFFQLFWLPVFGKAVPAIIEHPLEESRIHIGKNTVAYEARKLLSLIYEVTCWKE